MKKPVLKQFRDLVVEDFQRCPVWISCHIVDYDEPWYDETDEETVRPWTGGMPVDRSQEMLLVRAKAVCRDGTEWPGFLTPDQGRDMGIVQPHVFVGNSLVGFWGGMIGIPPEAKRAFYEASGKSAASVFPLRVSAESGLVQGECVVEVLGFYRSPNLSTSEVEY